LAHHPDRRRGKRFPGKGAEDRFLRCHEDLSGVAVEGIM